MTASTLIAPPADRVRTYASFVRFEHTLFSLPLVLAGIFSVPGQTMPIVRWLLVAIAAVGARTAAMALNRLIDRRLDALNPRTQARELPAGAMTLPEALLMLFVSVALYALACAALGRWFLRVAPIPILVFTIYPYLKRVTPLCHLGVGLALALAPLAGYAAAHPDLMHVVPALWLAAFAFLWVSGFDVIYATLDEAFDRAHGVHSLVAWLGRERALRVSALLHLLAFVCLVGVAITVMDASALGPHAVTVAFDIASSPHPTVTRALMLAAPAGLLVLAAALLFLEQRWAEDVDLAFFKVNVWVGAVVLALVVAIRLGFGGL